MEWLLDLDVKSFWALSQSSDRVNAAKKIENAWTAMIAAQGQSGGMKKWLKPWTKKIDRGDSAADFLTKFGEGF